MSRDFNDYIGPYKGQPGLVVSAGPSLLKNIELVKKWPGVVMAVDSAVPHLLRIGYVPKFVCCIDPITLKAKIFEGRDELKDSVMFTIPTTNEKMRQAFQGEKLAISTLPPQYMPPTSVKRHHIYDVCMTVAHFAFCLVRDMGCEPIAFIGQDLSFGPNGETHAEGSVGVWGTGRIKLDNPHHTIDVPRWGGAPGMITTFRNMGAFIDTFAQLFASCDAKIYNATEGGATIPWGIDLPLADVLEIL